MVIIVKTIANIMGIIVHTKEIHLKFSIHPFFLNLLSS